MPEAQDILGGMYAKLGELQALCAWISFEIGQSGAYAHLASTREEWEHVLAMVDHTRADLNDVRAAADGFIKETRNLLDAAEQTARGVLETVGE